MRRAVMSLTPPGANGTTMRTGRVGYACAQAMRDAAGSAAAPAARCRKVRRGSFMASLSERRDASFRLDVGRPDHPRPLGGIRLDDDSKLLRRIEGHLKTELRGPLAHVSLQGDLHDVRMHLADDGGRRAGWR